MPTYVCPRCEYSTTIRTHMKNHFNRQTPCTIIAEDKTIPECIEEVLGVIRSKPSKSPSNISYKPSKSLNFPPNPSFFPHNHSNISYKEGNHPNISYNEGNISYNEGSISYNTSKENNTDCITQSMTNSCVYCNRIYSRKDNLTRHLKICKLRHNIINDKTDTTSSDSEDTSNKDLYTRDEVVEMLQKTKQEFHFKEAQTYTIIQELRTQVEQLLRNQGSNNITYNTNIVLNAFGKENTNYISKDYIKGLISSGPINSIPKLLQHIHFNPEHQENHNIKIPNKKQPYAEIFNGSTWDITDRKQAIEDMTDKAYSIINQHYMGGNEYMNKFKDQYEHNDKSLTKKLSKTTEMMIINNQKLLS